MNYALDALWWRLTDPYVRDLAAILTAPPLWHSGSELSVPTLLGETGFRYLLDLNDYPEQLQQSVNSKQPFAGRLGFYAEHLLAFWLGNAPHTELLGHNVILKNACGQTEGAADFIALFNDEPYHLELTCKYYGCLSGRPSEMVGLNPNDSLLQKASKLKHQLSLFDSESGRKILSGLRVDPQKMKTASIVRGVGFSAQAQPVPTEPLNAYGWHGQYVEHWTDDIFSDGLEQRYYVFPRMNLLAPARVRGKDTVGQAEIRTVKSGIVAVLTQRPDGYWHESQRFMKMDTSI